MSFLFAALMAASCARAAEAPIVVASKPTLARRNSLLELTVYFIDGPGGSVEVPARCLSGWRIRGTGVTLDRSHRQLRIGPRAIPGETIALDFKVGGEHRTKHFIVHAEDEPVLAGTWTQKAGACHLFPYVELVFSDDGKLTYTSPEHMLETMSDGTLPYRWDTNSGEIVSTLFQGGRAAATVQGDELHLHAAAGCALTYKRN